MAVTAGPSRGKRSNSSCARTSRTKSCCRRRNCHNSSSLFSWISTAVWPKNASFLVKKLYARRPAVFCADSSKPYDGTHATLHGSGFHSPGCDRKRPLPGGSARTRVGRREEADRRHHTG